MEDELQTDVPETIKDLQLAGIKVWMITGDKFETAQSVGYACKLLKQDLQMLSIRNA